MQVLGRKKRAVKQIRKRQSIKIQKGVFSRLRVVQFFCNLFLKRTNHRNSAHIGRRIAGFSVKRAGHIHAFRIRKRSHSFDKRFVICIELFQRARCPTGNIRIVRSQRKYDDVRVRLVQCQRIRQHLRIIPGGGRQDSRRRNTVIRHQHFSSGRLANFQELRGVRLRHTIHRIALRYAVADKRDAQRLFIALRLTIYHVKTFRRQRQSFRIG